MLADFVDYEDTNVVFAISKSGTSNSKALDKFDALYDDDCAILLEINVKDVNKKTLEWNPLFLQDLPVSAAAFEGMRMIAQAETWSKGDFAAGVKALFDEVKYCEEHPNEDYWETLCRLFCKKQYAGKCNIHK